LEDEGVLGDVGVSELPLYFLALEDDVLSLELESSLSELYLVRPSFSINRKMADFNSKKIPLQFYLQ
jgi:vacuolar protein sorting-associated protein 33A